MEKLCTSEAGLAAAWERHAADANKLSARGFSKMCCLWVKE